MKLQLNGELRDFPDGLTLAVLVEHLAMKADRVAVELNLEIIPRTNWPAIRLKDGDKLEIIHFVGGGVDRRPRRRSTPSISRRERSESASSPS